jgi:broad specificity phosphatase PhoE
VRRFSALRPTRVLSSPLARSLEVGRALAEASGAPLVVEADLREIHRGSWQGRRVDELRATDADLLAAFYADPWTFRAHGGESDELLLARVWRVIEGALRGQEAHADEPATLVLTVHYNVIRVVAAHLLGIRPDRSFAFRIDPARAALFEDSPLGWKLHAANVSGPPRDELLELAELERSSPNAAGGPGACPTAAGGPGA